MIYKNSVFPLFVSILFAATFLTCTTTKLAAPVTTINNLAPNRFEPEIAKIQQISFNEQKARIVFTGSSSIRFWPDIAAYYPEHQIINTGFGGSQMSDLLYYLEETVLRFTPTKVFIYEGDNDIAAQQTIETILQNTKAVVNKIKQKVPEVQIILIAAKPSLARWALKEDYIKLNSALEAYARKQANCSFANVWDSMLDEQGKVLPNIFIEDGLHMNRAGYELWDKVIRPYVEQ